MEKWEAQPSGLDTLAEVATIPEEETPMETQKAQPVETQKEQPVEAQKEHPVEAQQKRAKQAIRRKGAAAKKSWQLSTSLWDNIVLFLFWIFDRFQLSAA